MLTYFLTLLLVVITAAFAGNTAFITQDGRLVHKNKYPFFAFLSIAILILVAGLRYKVGADYDQYVANFPTYSTATLQGRFWGAEPGIRIVAKLARFLGGDADLYLFLAALIPNGLILYRVYKDADNFLFSIVLFMLIGVWSNSFNAIRQFNAAAICFVGYPFLIKKSFLKWAITVLIASAFHVSVIIMLPIYFFVNRKINRKQISIAMIICIILSFSYDFLWEVVNRILSKDYAVEEMLYAQHGVKIWRTLVQWVPIAVYLFWGRRKTETPRDNVWINISLLNAMLMTVASQSAYLARVGIYTEIVNVFVFPLLISRIEDRRTRTIVTALAILFFLVYWYALLNGPDTNNFQFIWEK